MLNFAIQGIVSYVMYLVIVAGVWHFSFPFQRMLMNLSVFDTCRLQNIFVSVFGDGNFGYGST
jgi:hypothetical protein